MNAAGESNELFAFANGFGRASMSNFVVSGVPHDTINFALTTFEQNWFAGDTSELQDAMSLVNHGTGAASATFADVAGDTLTLSGVSKAMLMSKISGDENM